MAGGVLFGPAAWDPVAISAQIVALQCLYYLSLGLLYKLIVGWCWRSQQAGPRAINPPHTLPLPPPLCQPPPARALPARLACLPAGPYVPSLTLYHFFDWHWVTFSSFQGWMVCLAALTNAAIAAVYLRFIVSSRPSSQPVAASRQWWCRGCCLLPAQGRLSLVKQTGTQAYPSHRRWSRC